MSKKIKFRKPRYKLGQVIYYINYDVYKDEICEPKIDMSIIKNISYNSKYTWYGLSNGSNVDDCLCFKNYSKAYKYLINFEQKLKNGERITDESICN